MKKRKKVRQRKELFYGLSTDESNYCSGYVLIEANLEGEIEHTIKNITHVIGFLGDNKGQVIPLRPAEVNRILGKVDEMAEQSEAASVPYYVGESVKVNDGPFNG